MVKATYAGEAERNNTKGLLFKLKFTGNYGVNGVGDLLDLSPGAIADPTLSYNLILNQPPSNLGVTNEVLGGSYVALLPNANPTLQNLGVLMYEPGGAEKATNAAYTAAELAGFVEILVFVPLQ
jgi:hypothetical protein